MDEKWEQLMSWLKERGLKTEVLVERRERKGAGHGLFAVKPITPGTVLFSIPASALLNIKTLAPIYKKDSGQPLTLSAHQIISVHIYLRTRLGQDQADNFDPFISILPRDFDSHPLVWLEKSKIGMASTVEEELLERLPPSVSASLDVLHSRFHADKSAVFSFLDKHPHLDIPYDRSTEARPLDYLCAWLNVNTRCVYHQIRPSQSHPDNITLCPIMDFANHSPSHPRMTLSSTMSKVPRPAAPAIRSNGSMTFVCNAESVESGQEIFITYGQHAQRKLFVEYGFVNDETNILSGSEAEGEVDLQDLIEPLFLEAGESGLFQKNLLSTNGYWGDWTIHGSPAGGYPSFRTMAALRALYVSPASSASADAWLDVIRGSRDIIDRDNEESWRRTLLGVCQQAHQRAQDAITPLQQKGGERGNSLPEWAPWAHNNLLVLWKEQEMVAKAVIESLGRGDDF